MKKQDISERAAVRKILGSKMPESDRVLHLRKQVDLQHSLIARLRNALGSRQEFADSVCASVAAMEPFPLFAYRAPKGSPKPIVAVLKLSDWHIGEVVKTSETGGFNRFNWAIAQSRIHNIVRDFCEWVDVQRNFYRIDKCAVFGEGDYVSGDIHGELLATNEFPLPEQTAKAGLLLGEVLRILCGRFKEVEAFLVGADNHGRLQKKPQAKQKTSNNMSFLVHALAKSHTAMCKNLRMTVSEDAKLLCNVNGKKFLIEHGDNIRGVLGIPYYGIGRLIGKEGTRRMNTDKGFDYLSIAHFHCPAIIEMRTLVNGSLSGTTEFDHGQGRHARPSQVAFLVHPKHGVFNWVPFHGYDS